MWAISSLITLIKPSELTVLPHLNSLELVRNLLVHEDQDMQAYLHNLVMPLVLFLHERSELIDLGAYLCS